MLRRRCQANTAFTDPAHLMCTLRQGLRRIQGRPTEANSKPFGIVRRLVIGSPVPW